MKNLIRIVLICGLFSLAQVVHSVDLFQTGETLTADELNDLDQRIMELEQRIMSLQKTYVIGDTGPAGGIVFYVTGLGHHGLEAAPSDQAIPSSPGAEWGCHRTAIPGADGTAIGTGAQNTADILAGCATAGIAARLADDFALNGYSDWFLPSQDELNELYTNRLVVGGFTSGFYWNSSELDGFFSRHQNFGNGMQGGGFKINSHGVRAVRAF